MVDSDASIPKDTFHAMDWTNRQQKGVNISCADCNPTVPQSSIFNAELEFSVFGNDDTYVRMPSYGPDSWS